MVAAFRRRSRRATRVGVPAGLVIGLLVVSVAATASPSAPTAHRSSTSVASGPADCDEGAAGPVEDCGAFTKQRPLVVVLDTSGSMSEQDDAGTVKLAGAQAALSQAIRQQRPGAVLGLWSYPGGTADDDGCLPGDFDIEVSTLEQRTMIAAIRGLTADGETPTGPALQTAVDQLKAKGYSGATLLLVSDGLANCGADPCEVTKQIRSDGFDVTIQAAGFQISPEGLDQLRCIASASGGSVVEASDAAELDAILQQFGQAAVDLEVTGIPTVTPAGSSTLVTATVANTSAVDVQNARVELNFGGGTSELIPPVLPPIVSLGNIKAGATVTHTWAVSYGARDKSGTAEWSAAAWGRNANPATADGTVEIVPGGLDLRDAGGVIATLANKRITIVGDSYSAGEGAGDYEAGTDVAGGNRCHHSRSTYIAPLFSKGDVELLACSGATTRYYRGSNKDHNGVQEEQVGRLVDQQADDGAVYAGFMTVGGNDIGFGDIVATCLVGHASNAGKLAAALNRTPGLAGLLVDAAMLAATWDHRCSDDESWKADIYDSIAHLGGDLEDTYRQIYEAMNQPRFVKERDGAIAPLYILPYPQPFPERQWASFCPGFDTEEVAFANDLVDRLDARIEATVNRMRKDRYRISFVTPVQGAFLPDHTACARPGTDPYLNPITLASAALPKAGDKLNGTAVANQFMHPNKDGYAAETDVVLAWSAVTEDPDSPPQGGSWRQGKDPAWSVPLAPSWPTVVATLTPPVPDSSPLVVDAGRRTITSDPVDARGGQSIPIEVHDAAPGALVRVSIQSRRTVIGVFHVDSDGNGTGEAHVPLGTAAGGHRLTILTLDADGNPVTVTQEADIARRLPFWLTPLAAATLLCALLSALFGWRERRRRRRA